MEIVDSNKYGVASREDLSSLFKKIRKTPPEDYQQYLLHHNGGMPKPKDFQISSTEGESGIHVMYGLADTPEWQSILEAHKTFKARMPASVLPIASDDLGNQIVISCSGKNVGAIWFWDHERTNSWFNRWRNMTQIGNSWSEFVSSLFEYIDPDETLWEKIIRTRDVNLLNQYILDDNDLDLKDARGQTLIEYCAIAAANEFIVILHSSGAKLGNALKFAEKNAKYFDEHKETVTLLKSLTN